jgi:hypothetical protein
VDSGLDPYILLEVEHKSTDRDIGKGDIQICRSVAKNERGTRKD